MLQKITYDLAKNAKLNIINLLILNIFARILFLYLTNDFLFREDMLHSGKAAELNLSAQDLSYARNFFNMLFIYDYFLSVVSLLIYSFILTIILTGIFRFLKINLETSLIFRSVLIAELVFVLPLILKFLWFALIHPYATLKEMNFFAPLSIDSLFGIEDLNRLEHAIYRQLNLF